MPDCPHTPPCPDCSRWPSALRMRVMRALCRIGRHDIEERLYRAPGNDFRRRSQHQLDADIDAILAALGQLDGTDAS